MSYFCLPVAEQFPCQRILFEIIVITFHNPDASMRNPHNLSFSWFSSPSSRVFQTFCLFLCFLYHSLKLFSWAWESPSVTSLRFLLQEADGFAFASADNPWSAHYTVETRGAVGLEDLKKKKTEFALPADSSRLSEGLSGQIRRPDVCGCEREQGRNDGVSVSLRRGAARFCNCCISSCRPCWTRHARAVIFMSRIISHEGNHGISASFWDVPVCNQIDWWVYLGFQSAVCTRRLIPDWVRG